MKLKYAAISTRGHGVWISWDSKEYNDELLDPVLESEFDGPRWLDKALLFSILRERIQLLELVCRQRDAKRFGQVVCNTLGRDGFG